MSGENARSTLPVFRSAFQSDMDEHDPNANKRPVVFDVLAPDYETSVLPEGLKMVLHVNPSTMGIAYNKIIERTQTKGGYVEAHWGDGAPKISFAMATGGFMRLFSGLSNITGGPGSFDAGGNRRETIAYDKYLDMLALFHNNGSVYDLNGKVVFQGILKITFDGGIYLGWFEGFTVNEAAEKPYQFALTAEFTVAQEVQRFRSMPWANTFEDSGGGFGPSNDVATTVDAPLRSATGVPLMAGPATTLPGGR